MLRTGSPARISLAAGLALGAAVFAAADLQAAPLSTSLQFGAGTGYPTSSSFNMPARQAVGDLNGDGVLDTVVTDGSQDLKLLFGTGGGGFNGAIKLFVPAVDPGPVLAVDVNGDQRPDIVFASNHNRKLTVLHNLGGGTFGAPTHYPMGWDTRTVAVGDLNGDGVVDLIGGDSNQDIRVFLGKTAAPGFFANGVSYPDGGINRQGMVVADWNGDGKNDVIVGNRDTGDVSVLMGNGDGTLTPYVRFSGHRGETVIVRDVNGDQVLDLVTPGQFGAIETIAVRLGSGNGGAGAVTLYPTGGAGAFLLAAGDVDGDGNLDIAASHQNSHTVSILLGNGAGAFGAPALLPNPVNHAILSAGGQPAVADLDMDGRQDIAVVSMNNDLVTVFLNNTVMGPSSCDPGSFLANNSCVLAPAGSYSEGGTATSATLCPAGTFSATAGAAACTPAPAGSYVPATGATSATACPAHYSSNTGATSCFPLDTDGDGVKDFEDAVISSNLSATVSVGACTAAVANQVLANGASFNDLMVAAVSGAANHGARVSAVSALANGWKNAGLISGRDHGAIVSCVAKAK